MKKFFQYLSSLKLAISCFILLGGLIFLGSYLPQEPLLGRAILLEHYGDNYWLVNSLRLNDVFHSFYFIGIFALLAANLISVSFLRVFPRSKKAFKENSFLSKVPEKVSDLYGELKMDVTQWSPLKSRLKAQGWSVKESEVSIIASKNKSRLLSASITHIGILCILAGGALSLLWGFNGVILGVPGDNFRFGTNDSNSIHVFHSPLWWGKVPRFVATILNTEIQRHPQDPAFPDNWQTTLSFRKNKDVQIKALAVNQPVSFSGIDFYQADWQRVLRLHFNGRDYEIKLDQVKGHETAFFKASPELGLLAFLEEKNNAQILRLFAVDSKAGGLAMRPLGKLRQGEHLRLGPMDLVFRGGYAQTGIHFKSSPGDILMITGMLIMLVGVGLMFQRYELLWVLKQENSVYILFYKHKHKAPDLSKLTGDTSQRQISTDQSG